jgi:hypothetical protein
LDAIGKSFLLLFSKKEVLLFLSYSMDALGRHLRFFTPHCPRKSTSVQPHTAALRKVFPSTT